jgi:hypothetical protein
LENSVLRIRGNRFGKEACFIIVLTKGNTMQPFYWIGLMLLLGAAPVLSQAQVPENKPGRPFRYYQPGLHDSLRIFSPPRRPGSLAFPGKIKPDYKFNNRDPRFHSALPLPGGMPTYQPAVRDKMPVVKPDSLVKYHLRIKPIRGGKTYQ